MSQRAGRTGRIGIDTGGTFTDLVRLGPGGLAVHKLRSTPDDPSRAIVAGIEALNASGHSSGPTTGLHVVHGSTVATNAVLERKGATVALITTEGFEDVLRIGRQTRPELYNFQVPARRPIVAPELTFGIRERLDASGAPLEPVDLAAVGTRSRSTCGPGASTSSPCVCCTRTPTGRTSGPSPSGSPASGSRPPCRMRSCRSIASTNAGARPS